MLVARIVFLGLFNLVALFWINRTRINPNMAQSANHPALKELRHRPWPLPKKRPLLSQVWQNLLFIHWEVSLKQVQAAVPKTLEIDTYDGKAWIAIVPFDMKKVTLNGIPPISALSDFPEINVRTYVKHKGKPGVWFFSLDVPSKIAVWIAQRFFHLPYRYAHIEVIERDNAIYYQHKMGKSAFTAHYKPIRVAPVSETSFETWATERYCLYCKSKKGHLYRTEVQHQKWPLQQAEIDIQTNTLLDTWDLGLRHPSVLFSKHLDVLAYAPERLG